MLDDVGAEVQNALVSLGKKSFFRFTRHAIFLKG